MYYHLLRNFTSRCPLHIRLSHHITQHLCNVYRALRTYNLNFLFIVLLYELTIPAHIRELLERLVVLPVVVESIHAPNF